MIIGTRDLKLSAQRGLLGNVFPELRAVCINSEENLIETIFYIDGEISDDQNECCESTMDDIIADFFEEGLEFSTPIIRLDYPERPTLVGSWAYYRQENYQENQN